MGWLGGEDGFIGARLVNKLSDLYCIFIPVVEKFNIAVLPEITVISDL